MKILSYICLQEEVKEKRNWLSGLGLNVFRQTSIIDMESTPLASLVRITFAIPNKEIETFLRLTYPEGTFAECSA